MRIPHIVVFNMCLRKRPIFLVHFFRSPTLNRINKITNLSFVLDIQERQLNCFKLIDVFFSGRDHLQYYHLKLGWTLFFRMMMRAHMVLHYY